MEMFAEKIGVRLTRPTKRAEMRIKALEDSTIAEDVSNAVAEIGGCKPDEIQVGPIRFAYKGMGTAWFNARWPRLMKLRRRAG